MSKFLSLPIELIIRIVGDLDPKDILSFGLLNRRTQGILQTSSLLRYKIALDRYGMEQFHTSPLTVSFAERLAFLEEREHNWSTLNFARKHLFRTNFDVSGLYDLNAGVLLLGEKGDIPEQDPLIRTSQGRKVHHLFLAQPPVSAGSDERDGDEEERLDEQALGTVWDKLTFEARVIDIGLALQEHDLIAAVTSEIFIDSSDHIAKEKIGLHLVEYSTGRLHPLATQVPDLKVSEYPHICENVFIEIVGKYLALLIAMPPSKDDIFIIFNWMTGENIYEKPAPACTYGAPIFITSHLLLVSNLLEPSLELLLIKETGTSTTVEHIRSLGLPALTEGTRLLSVPARADPNIMGSNPTFSSSKYLSKASRHNPNLKYGVRSNPSRAIILFHLFVANFRQRQNRHMFCEFSFVVHRSSLMKLAFDLDKDLCAYDVVPWEAWGPAASSWDVLPNDENPYITGTAGQRQVMLGSHTSHELVIRDFNKFAYAEFKQDSRFVTQDKGNSVEISKSVRVRELNHPEFFRQKIRSELPFIQVRLRKQFMYDGIMVDDDHIIGLLAFDDETGYEGNEVEVLVASPYKAPPPLT